MAGNISDDVYKSVGEMSLFGKLKMPEIKVEGPKIEYEFQELGVEMENHFGKRFKSSIWANFHKPQYPFWMIQEAWLAYKKQSIKSFPYYMGILNRKAGIKKVTKK